MQAVQFSIYFHILDIHGSDVILGMAWLESLGKVSADFVGKTLEFNTADRSHIIRGFQSHPCQISLQSLFILSDHSLVHEFYELIPLEASLTAPPSSDNVVFSTNIPMTIRSVLEEFRTVFTVPTGMPPKREFDHKIHLLPDHLLNRLPQEYGVIVVIW